MEPIKIGHNRILFELNNKDKMIVLENDNISNYLLNNRVSDPSNDSLLEQMIKKEMVVVEIGANIGSHSLTIAKQIGSGGKLFCFEIDPEIAEVLRANIFINNYQDRVKVFNKGCYSTSGEFTLNISEVNRGASSILPEIIAKEKYFYPNIEFTQKVVEVVPLDEVLGDQKVDFIKMDAEGSEPEILKGMTKILNNNQPDFLMEWGHFRDRNSEVWDLFKNMGYRFFKTHDKKELNSVEDINSLLSTSHIIDCYITKNDANIAMMVS